MSKKDDEIVKEGFIRWSPDELSMFKNWGSSSQSVTNDKVSINVLEFFAVFHFLLTWRHELKGMVIRTNCDNTATVTWLSRMRTCGRSSVSEALMKL